MQFSPSGKKSSLVILAFSSLWVSFLSSRNLAEFQITSGFEWEGKRLVFLLLCNNREYNPLGLWWLQSAQWGQVMKISYQEALWLSRG